MANNIIDSIQLSGVTYTIQGSGGGGNPTVELTQAEYDALVTGGTISANTYYIITDAPSVDISQLVSTSAITTAITSSSTNSQVPSAKAVNDKLGGMNVVKLTESEYTALVTKDSNTLYVVIPDPSN